MKSAAQHGWEAVIIAFMAVSTVLVLAWLGKNWMREYEQRERRMAERIDKLEDYQRTVLTEIAKENAVALNALVQMLNNRPCLLDSATLKELAAKTGNHSHV